MRKISVRRESAGKNEDLYDPRFVDYRRGPMLSLAALGQCRFELIEKTGKTNFTVDGCIFETLIILYPDMQHLFESVDNDRELDPRTVAFTKSPDQV